MILAFPFLFLVVSSTLLNFIAPLNSDLSDVPSEASPSFGHRSFSSSIKYNYGSKVLTDDVNLYMIYYGANWTDSQKEIINEFANNIGDSAWYKTTRAYYYQESVTSNKIYVNGAVRVAATVSDLGSLGTHLSGSSIPNMIQSLINAGTLPEDDKGIYFVLSSPEVSESIRPDVGTANFCTDYCGYHISTNLTSGKRVQYSFIGNPQSLCSASCGTSLNQRVSPNNDTGIDALLSSFAHELTETVSDPISDIHALRAWQDPSGSENADKCAWKFGNYTKSPLGYSYNTLVGSKNYMVSVDLDL